jgi:protoporphyrinogen oxidase
MFREIMAIRTSQMMTSRSLICLLENQYGGKLQKMSLTEIQKQTIAQRLIDEISIRAMLLRLVLIKVPFY